jgi:fumarate reductase subunit D
MRRKKSSEPLWWIPFAGGMMINAMVMPALIIITGFLIPLGLVDTEGLFFLLNHPLSRIFLFVVISLTFFHAAHRLRFVLPDLGMHFLRPVLIGLYFLAILATIATGAMALRLY